MQSSYEIWYIFTCKIQCHRRLYNVGTMFYQQHLFTGFSESYIANHVSKHQPHLMSMGTSVSRMCLQMSQHFCRVFTSLSLSSCPSLLPGPIPIARYFNLAISWFSSAIAWRSRQVGVMNIGLIIYSYTRFFVVCMCVYNEEAFHFLCLFAQPGTSTLRFHGSAPPSPEDTKGWRMSKTLITKTLSTCVCVMLRVLWKLDFHISNLD